MEDNQEPSEDEHTLSPIVPDPASSSTAARHLVLLSLIQVLDQSDLDDIVGLERSIKPIIAGRLRVLNDKHSLLLRLPTELVVTIGYLVMSERQCVSMPGSQDPPCC